MALVHVPGPLASLYPDGRRTVSLEGSTVADLLVALDGRWPGMRDRLCEVDGRPRPYIRLFVDGDPAEPTTRVTDGSTVHVLLAIAGG